MNDRIKRMKESKALAVLLSVLVACIIWFYVDNEQMPTIKDTIRNVPISVVGQEALAERGLMVTQQSAQDMDLHLEGKRYALLELTSKNVLVSVDVSSIQESGTYDLLCNVTLPSGIVSGTAAVTERSSYRVKLTVEERVTKSVEIEGKFVGSIEDGYRAGEFLLSPSEIEISGPLSVIEQIEKARVTLDEDDLKQTYTGLLPLAFIAFDGQSVDARKVECRASSVYVTYPVEIVKELELTVEIVAGGGARAEDVSWEIFPKTLTLSGRKEVLEGLTEFSLGKIELAEIVGNSVLLCPIVLPDGVNSDEDVKEAKLAIKFNGLTTKAFEATDFELVNLPEGYAAEVLTVSLPVSVRGPEEVIDRVDASKLKVIVDLSDVTPEVGEIEVPAQVVLAQDDSVGVIRADHTVRVVLSR